MPSRPRVPPPTFPRPPVRDYAGSRADAARWVRDVLRSQIMEGAFGGLAAASPALPPESTLAAEAGCQPQRDSRGAGSAALGAAIRGGGPLPERTTLAWTRTSFAFLANGALLTLRELHSQTGLAGLIPPPVWLPAWRCAPI